MTNPVWETMTFWQAPNGYTVRVWREEEPKKGPSCGPDKEVMDILESLSQSWPGLILRLAELDRVSAIEVLDPNKNGTIFYPDWK